MREKIAVQLDALEKQHGIRIVYAVESGSRAWGFESPDSDYDVRFLYVRDAREYVRIDLPRDVIELPIINDLDINGWDLLKALDLFRKSNPPLLEWLYSPIIYLEPGTLASRLREIAGTGYSARRMAYHYLSMARGNYRTSIAGRDEVSLKKYLYVLRPLACIRWIEQRGGTPPTAFQETLDGIDLERDIRTVAADLLVQKKLAGEVGKAAPNTLLNTYIETEIGRMEQVVTDLPDPRMEAGILNVLAWKELGL